jgi:hypothetical protein
MFRYDPLAIARDHESLEHPPVLAFQLVDDRLSWNCGLRVSCKRSWNPALYLRLDPSVLVENGNLFSLDEGVQEYVEAEAFRICGAWNL